MARGMGGNPFRKPIRLREVCYTLSSNHVKVLPGLWKDLPHKIKHKLEGWPYAVIVVGGFYGPIWYIKHLIHQQELAHRY